MTSTSTNDSLLAELSLLNYRTIEVLKQLYSSEFDMANIDSLMLYQHMELANTLGDCDLTMLISSILDSHEGSLALSDTN